MKCPRSGSALSASKDRNDLQRHLTLEILNCDPLKCTMDYTRLIVSYQIEEFIIILKVKDLFSGDNSLFN